MTLRAVLARGAETLVAEGAARTALHPVRTGWAHARAEYGIVPACVGCTSTSVAKRPRSS